MKLSLSPPSMSAADRAAVLARMAAPLSPLLTRFVVGVLRPVIEDYAANMLVTSWGAPPEEFSPTYRASKIAITLPFLTRARARKRGVVVDAANTNTRRRSRT